VRKPYVEAIDNGKGNSMYATESQADYEYARNAGRERPQQAWILSDRDCWYRNPFYQGAPQPHPESGDFGNDVPPPVIPVYAGDEEIPF
jgi:hypothetical protein